MLSCSSVCKKEKVECIFEMVNRTIRVMESLWEIGSQCTKLRARRRDDHCL